MKLPKGWIAHNGGPCPVRPNRRVQIWCRGERWSTVQRSVLVFPDEYGPQWLSGAIIAYKPETPHAN